MSFRAHLNSAPDSPSEEHSMVQSGPSSARSGWKLWQTALLLAGSAAFGGLAVAFWNRKMLAELRNQVPEPRRTAGREDDIY
jgi:hypothetical protein